MRPMGVEQSELLTANRSSFRLPLVSHFFDGDVLVNALMDENALVEAASTGDQKAFIELIRRHDDALRALAFSMTGNASDMDDVLQTSYLKAFQSMRKFNRKSSFKTWIYRIVHNTTADLLRKQVRITHIDGGQIVEAALVERDHALSLDIDAALMSLSNEARAVVLLVDGEGFDYVTAGAALGIPPGTVASRLNQARLRLRSLLTSSYKDTQ